MGNNVSKIPSPCMKECKIDVDLGICTECKRTLTEISAWSGMSDEEKIRILKRIQKREPGISDY
jgi:predicted Fe-S protein YdhL (DUF1289 family)